MNFMLVICRSPIHRIFLIPKINKYYIFSNVKAEIMTQYNNETKESYISKFNELKAEDDQFKAKMTERDVLILEAQGLITNGEERRKREGV